MCTSSPPHFVKVGAPFAAVLEVSLERFIMNAALRTRCDLLIWLRWVRPQVAAGAGLGLPGIGPGLPGAVFFCLGGAGQGWAGWGWSCLGLGCAEVRGLVFQTPYFGSKRPVSGPTFSTIFKRISGVPHVGSPMAKKCSPTLPVPQLPPSLSTAV